MPFPTLRPALRSTVAALFVLSSLAGAEARDLYRWVQYVPGGIEARAVTSDDACPAATIDGVSALMQERSAPGPAYPVRGCALPVPQGAKLVTVGGVPAPLPKPRADRILLVGDTGCRLKGSFVQACNDASKWPFRLGAAMSAWFKPDLVIHVGDMHYRESECPAGNLGCAGTPFGDTWDVWKDDFFNPGESLLNAAPWIMVRGNHEECERGGIGWARTLDPYPFDAATGASGCLGPQAPYAANIGGVTVLVMDVSTADERANEKQAAFFRPQFEMANSIEGFVWYAFHRPVWAADAVILGRVIGDNGTLALAARGAMPPNALAILSGHHHTFEIMKYDADLPLQIVSGHGGDELSTNAPSDVRGLAINGVKVVEGIGRPGVFGFSIMERDTTDTSGAKWTLTGYDVAGREIGRCRLAGRDLSCD